MEGKTFRGWLEQRVGDEPGQVSRRELARKLAEKTPGKGDPESYRRSIRRILMGERNPSQATRDAIQDALGDRSAPTLSDEESDAGVTAEEMSVWQRVNRKLSMGARC